MKTAKSVKNVGYFLVGVYAITGHALWKIKAKGSIAWHGRKAKKAVISRRPKWLGGSK